MSQTQRDESGQSAVMRAEELVEQMGLRVGLLVALTSQRIQMAATSLRESASRVNQPRIMQEGEARQPTPEQPEEMRQLTVAQTEEANRPAIEKAEEIVGRAGQRLGRFADLASLQIRRITALARENVEDMWVDAQDIRNQSHREPQ